MYDKERVEYLLQQDRTPDNIDELIVLNYGLLNAQLKKFFLLTDPDAISFGYEALYKAILTFNPKQNNKFSTYATVCIYNRLGSYVRSLKTQLVTNTVFYETPVHNNLRLVDTLESPHKAETYALDNCGTSTIYRTIEKYVDSLTNPLHKLIIIKWIESDYEMTHVAIAEEVCCSQVYVSQVLKKFKNTLKKKLEALQ